MFDVGAAGKGAAGVSHGVSGILQSARRGAASDAASDMAGLLWQQWMLGENSELSQMRRAMLAAGLTEEEAAFKMGMALANRFGTDAAEGAITAGMSDALGRGVRGVGNWLGETSEPANAAQGLDTTPDAGDNKSIPSYKELEEWVRQLPVDTQRNTAVFYSGPGNRARAEEFARVNDKTTLEMTPGGRRLDDLHLYSLPDQISKEEADALWRIISQRYASGASGNTYGFVEGANPGSVFNTVEAPTLESLYRSGQVTNLFTELLKKGGNPNG